MPQSSPAKAALRREILARRDALAAGTRATLSERITAHLQAQPALHSARATLAYLSFGSEYRTEPLLAALLARGVQLALPRVNRERRELEVFQVHALDADTAPGVWGIREPRPERCLRAALESIDLILVPGVAFTARGNRLGYGGGYYDRLLSRWPHPRPFLVAAAFAIQVVDAMPSTPLDVPVDLVVTENGSLRHSAASLPQPSP